MTWLYVLLLGGCLQPPDFPLLDEIPIVPYAETCAPARDALVVCTIDGDTFDLTVCSSDLGERVRMLGIDAPETAKGDTPADCYADDATAELRDLLDGQRVLLTFDAECTGAFDRTLAYVWLMDRALEDAWRGRDLSAVTDRLQAEDPEDSAVMLNEWMLYAGFARLYPEEIAGTLIYQARLNAAEASARSRGEGLWSFCDEGGG
ncbi:MAG: endonuclease YncB(thermonuclease family) [Myxococcota bacterium]|jgi:endonuclease YncB( thermonuclease family)